MSTIRTCWQECSWFRRVLLIVPALEILALAIATAAVVNRPGLKYENTQLYPSAEEELQVCQGCPSGSACRAMCAAGTRRSPRSSISPWNKWNGPSWPCSA